MSFRRSNLNVFNRQRPAGFPCNCGLPHTQRPLSRNGGTYLASNRLSSSIRHYFVSCYGDSISMSMSKVRIEDVFCGGGRWRCFLVRSRGARHFPRPHAGSLWNHRHLAPGFCRNGGHTFRQPEKSSAGNAKRKCERRQE
jgi:hypothetical protein